jgi:hypothetical protein
MLNLSPFCYHTVQLVGFLKELTPAFMELRKKMEARIADLAAIRAARQVSSSGPATLSRAPDTGPTDHSIILNAIDVMKQFMAQQQHLMLLSGMGAAFPPLPLGATCPVPQASVQNQMLQAHTSAFPQFLQTQLPEDTAVAPLATLPSHGDGGTLPVIGSVGGNVSGGGTSTASLAMVPDATTCAPARDCSAQLPPAILPVPQPLSRKVCALILSFQNVAWSL